MTILRAGALGQLPQQNAIHHATALGMHTDITKFKKRLSKIVFNKQQTG